MKTEKRSKAGFDILNPKALYNPIPYGYSHVASIHPHSKLIFVAGQGGEDAEGNIHLDFRTQVRQAFENIKKALQEVAGCSIWRNQPCKLSFLHPFIIFKALHLCFVNFI